MENSVCETVSWGVMSNVIQNTLFRIHSFQSVSRLSTESVNVNNNKIAHRILETGHISSSLSGEWTYLLGVLGCSTKISPRKGIWFLGAIAKWEHPRHCLDKFSCFCNILSNGHDLHRNQITCDVSINRLYLFTHCMWYCSICRYGSFVEGRKCSMFHSIAVKYLGCSLFSSNFEFYKPKTSVASFRLDWPALRAPSLPAHHIGLRADQSHNCPQTDRPIFII